nr:MAG TPA: hypothetical protein [Caudoviricetes sp.]
MRARLKEDNPFLSDNCVKVFRLQPHASSISVFLIFNALALNSMRSTSSDEVYMQYLRKLFKKNLAKLLTRKKFLAII